MKTYKALVVTLVCGLLALAYSGQCAAASNGKTVTEDNITYGKAGDTELKLDLARPQGDGPFPAIVFIHGGGWCEGNRQGYRGQIQEAARRGYVAVTIDYRLMKFDRAKKETTTATTIFPAQIHDAKAAVRWVRANAQKYHVDPNRIGVTGGSAGGHLSLLVGLADASAGLEGNSGNPDQSSGVQAVVNTFGPTEMAACYKKSLRNLDLSAIHGWDARRSPRTVQSRQPHHLRQKRFPASPNAPRR